MWTSFFWAVGIFLLLIGAETLVVEKFVVADSKGIPRLFAGNNLGTAGAPSLSYATGAATKSSARTIVTKDWMPWCFLAAGAVTIMYTSSFQQKSAPPK